MCSCKKSTDENWIRHGSISFSQFRTCMRMYGSLCVLCKDCNGDDSNSRLCIWMNQYFGIYFMTGFTVDFPKIRYQVCRRIAILKTLYTFTSIGNSFFSQNSCSQTYYLYQCNTQYIYVIYSFTVEIMLTFTQCTAMQTILMW